MKAVLTATFEAGLDGKTIPKIRQEPPLTANWTDGPNGCILYTSNQAGVLLGGDEHTYNYRVHPGAHAVITGVSASKYGSQRQAAASEQTLLRVDDGGILEWIPEPQIVFAGANTRQDVKVEIAPSSRLIFFALHSVGRVASGERHRYERWQQRVVILRGDEPLLIETWDVRPREAGAEIETLMEGYSYAGLGFVADGQGETLPLLARSLGPVLGEGDGGDVRPPWIGGVSTARTGDLVIRWLCDSAADSRRLMMETWSIARRALLGLDPPELGKF
ncbi:MAG: urease accessory protein UreD [Nitrospirae bacterium]|nr:urease accessory protein UreD [Nitrospirota bacterium]